MEVLGVDIGGTGIKGAPVDTATGALLAERYRLETPQPAMPKTMVDTVAKIAEHFDWRGPIGAGFPAAIRQGVVLTASNIDKSWIGMNAEQMIRKATDSPTVRVLNDADVAGIAEVALGAGKGVQGVVLMITLGTGIGTALFTDGKLLPNTELGHLELDGKDAEKYAAESAREREDLSWEKWAKRVTKYLNAMENLFWPDLVIIGGGISKKHEKFFPLLNVRTRIVPAQLLNEAGIVGAALAATGK